MHHSILRYITEVARQGSIRRAATALNVASSAINRQIIKAEANFGVLIFNRSADGVEVTDIGEAVVAHCERTLRDYTQLQMAIASFRNQRTGHIRISAIDSTTLHLIPDVIASFRRRHPDVTFTIRTVEPEDTMEDVADGAADIGLSFTRMIHQNVRVVAERPAPFGFLVHADHPLANTGEIALDQCLGYRFVRTHNARGNDSLVNRDLNLGLVNLSTVMHASSLIVAKQAILDRMGIGIYTKIGFQDEIAAGTVRFVRLADPIAADYRLGVIIPAQRYLAPLVQSFVTALARQLKACDFS